MNELKAKQAIETGLKGFGALPLAGAGRALFESLGYKSDLRLNLSPNSFENFVTTFASGKTLNPKVALPDQWKSVDFLFQLTDDEIRAAGGQRSLFESGGVWDGAAINSYVFLAIELKEANYTRTALAGITREVNKLFAMPAMILFRHGDALTLSVINRRLHKRDAAKDVLEKVTLIKDIQFAQPHRAHVEILFDLSIDALHEKHEFSNFVQLHAAWQKTLDTSALNKRFYQELACWYFWALDQVRFPKDAPKDADGHESLSLIRLITRVIFCWFLKEKNLLPDALFDPRKAPSLLADASPKESTYYKAILQNLFFATLNQEMDKREFRRDGQNFMAHNLYRYRKLLKDPDAAKALFASIPFMNGGLLECLDKCLGTKEKPVYVRIDGFSDRDDNLLKVPNDLFFGPEREVDLSETFGEARYSRAKVRGLIHILDRYKFTVAENTPIEEEVALDPELLGRVFENLLAAYNPETGATARKQTGSFYTPREIVNYMVDESLIACLGAKLEAGVPGAERVEERLRHLFAYNDQPHQFSDAETTALIDAIDHLKILDPACGSGAFPMGVLHKLVFVLAKIDPGNQRWKARQIAKAEEIPDATVRERVVADIEQAFTANELDYGRKLYLIENCIYGVDIQPIAVQISKLRFFISLIVDQRANPRAENLGIRPLPNLETKFVAANTLIGIEKPEQGLLRNPQIDTKEAELRVVRERHFNARTPATKAKYRDQDARLREEIVELLRADDWNSETAMKLAAWDPYDQNASADFFDLEWMYGWTAGFDLVLGNPPYVDSEQMVRTSPDFREYLARVYTTTRGNWDLYIPFWECSLLLAKDNTGVVHLLTPNKWLSIEYGRALRETTKSRVRQFADYSRFRAFENTGVFPIAVQMHALPSPSVSVASFADSDTLRFEKSIRRATLLGLDIWGVLLSEHFPLIARLVEDNGKLADACSLENAFSVSEAYQLIPYLRDEGHFSSDRDFRFINTGTIDPFVTLWGKQETTYIKNKYLRPVVRRNEFQQAFPRRYEVARSAKLLISGMRHFEAFFDEDGTCVPGKSTVIARPKDKSREAHCLILGVLNSKLARFFLRECYGSLAMDGGISFTPTNTAELPFPRTIARAGLEHLCGIVERILKATHSGTDDISSFQDDLDRAVYRIYKLTDEESKIIENSFARNGKTNRVKRSHKSQSRPFE